MKNVSVGRFAMWLMKTLRAARYMKRAFVKKNYYLHLLIDM